MYLRCKVICHCAELWAASQSRATVITAVSTRTTKSDRNSRPPRSRLCREFEGQQSWRHRLARHPALLAWRRCEPSFSEVHWRRSSAPPTSWPHAWIFGASDVLAACVCETRASAAAKRTFSEAISGAGASEARRIGTASARSSFAAAASNRTGRRSDRPFTR